MEESRTYPEKKEESTIEQPRDTTPKEREEKPATSPQKERPKVSEENSDKTTGEESAKEEKTQKETSSETAHGQTEKASLKSNQKEEDELDKPVEDKYYGIPVKPYKEMNQEALGEELERLLHQHKVKEIRQHVREIKTEFDQKFGAERDHKKEEFLADGGNIIDFSYSTPAEKKFNKLYFEYKEKRDQYYKDVRKNLQENLERRLGIIEELKAITGVGTDMNANFNTFKKIQEKWRKAGPVPRADYKNTWNTYHHHVERFYEFLHLDREFRELDYEHNLEQKLKIVARAEELTEEKDVNRAFRELQNLHRMWKEDVGPVSPEYGDTIWEKFSTATKKIHENRKAYFAKLDKKREDNLVAKERIIEAIRELGEHLAGKHHKVQNQIRKYKELRDQFFKAGKVPRKKNQQVWEAFKEASHTFNHKKNEFYKDRKIRFKDNLDEKIKLIKIAEEHMNSDDFEKVTPLMKKIQSDWKKIGYVPRGKSDKIWNRFQKACNHYFDRIHTVQDEKEEAKMENFHKKEQALKKLKALTLTGKKEEDVTVLKDKIEEWKALGTVPRNKGRIEKDFNKTLDQLFKQAGLNKKEAELLKYENRLQALEDADDDYKIDKESSFLQHKISQTEEEVRKLETNLSFFDNADKDNPLMKSTFNNIAHLKQQLSIWKAKLIKLKQL